MRKSLGSSPAPATGAAVGGAMAKSGSQGHHHHHLPGGVGGTSSSSLPQPYPSAAMAETASLAALKDEDQEDDCNDMDDDWMFDSVTKYHHLCMYKMDAYPLCLDVDAEHDQVALGVSRQFSKRTANTEEGQDHRNDDNTSLNDEGGGGGDGYASSSATAGNGTNSDDVKEYAATTTTTYQLLILKIPDKISARKTEEERDLSNNRDLKYLAGSDLGGNMALRQVRFYDSETCFALQTSILTCWKITPNSDVLTHLFSIRFDEQVGNLRDFRISCSKLSVYLGFDFQYKIRHYKLYREPSDERDQIYGSADGPLRLKFDESWTKSNLYFKEGNLAGHDLWFWNVIFDNDARSRPQVYLDDQLIDSETSRQLFSAEWASSPAGQGPQLGWYYRPNLGLYAATVRLKELPECRMITLRSRHSTRWDCRTARLGFAIDQDIHPDIVSRPEIKVFPEPNNSSSVDSNTFRVILAAANSVFCYQVTESAIYEMFHHDAHKATVIKVALYPANPDVVFSTDSDMNVHVWWPSSTTSSRMQPPRRRCLPNQCITAASSCSSSTASAATTTTATEPSVESSPIKQDAAATDQQGRHGLEGQAGSIS